MIMLLKQYIEHGRSPVLKDIKSSVAFGCCWLAGRFPVNSSFLSTGKARRCWSTMEEDGTKDACKDAPSELL